METLKNEFVQILNIVKECGGLVASAHDVEARDDAITVKPGAANFVTVYDVRVQEMLIGRLRALYPRAYFYAEEKENSRDALQNEVCFIIDPIDGTTNFIHDMKCSVISVGLYTNGLPAFGCVYDPYKDEMFYAAAGQGAYLNGAQISVSQRPLSQALVSVGTSPYMREQYAERTFARMKAVFMACADIRRSGSAALDVCYVACGRTDAYFEDILSPWDYAAGRIILREAGGELTAYDGTVPGAVQKSPVLCTNKVLHSQMLGLLNK